METCKICGEQIEHRRHFKNVHKITYQEYYDEYLKQDGEGICPTCGKPTNFIGGYYGGYAKYCSYRCSTLGTDTQEKRKATCQIKYGVDHHLQSKEIIKKQIETNKQKYGVKFVSQSQEIKDKIKQSFINHYGVDNNMKSDEGRKIYNDSMQEKYGKNWTFEIKEIQEKSKQTKLERYDDVNYNNREKAKETCLNKYGVENPQQVKEIRDKSIKHTISKQEDIIYKAISEIYHNEIIRNKRGIIGKYELDIYLPDINLAIEFNGIRYHSVEMGKPKDRILKKSLLCREKGIRLIHIYEFEDLNQQINLLKEFILGNDSYNPKDFNKNNFRKTIPKEPKIIFKNKQYTVYGTSKLY